MVGKDVWALMQDVPIKKITDIARPYVQMRFNIKAEDDRTDAKVSSTMAVAGNGYEADKFAALFKSFSKVSSFYIRADPLCEHQIKHFREVLIPDFCERYADTLPNKVPTPKMHGLGAHMGDQAELIGGVGLLNESIVETAHVAMNEFARRMACVTDKCKNIALRYQCYAHGANTEHKSIRHHDHVTAARKRVRSNYSSRRAKHAA